MDDSPEAHTGPGAARAQQDNRRAWEDWGRVDPLWSVVTSPDRRNGQWDRDEFFASGQATIDSLWSEASSRGLPTHVRRGLDFGCGVGRLTKALGAHVDHVVGLDISAPMVALAREYHADDAGLEFAVHEGTDLHTFDTGHFDVVCTLLVLQHIPSLPLIEDYVRELVRVLAPGGVLLLGLPTRTPPAASPVGLRGRLRPRTRLARALRRLGTSPHVLYQHLGWRPDMPMLSLPYERTTTLVEEGGGTVVWSSVYPDDGEGVDGCIYLVTR